MVIVKNTRNQPRCTFPGSGAHHHDGTHWHMLFPLVSAIVLISMLLASCQRSGIQPTPTALPTAPTTTPQPTVTPLPPQSPQILSTSPQPGEELATDGAIVLRFDQEMDQASVENALSIEPALVSQVSWDDARTARIKPKTGTFLRDTLYQLVLTDTAKSASGLPVRGPIRFQAQTVGYLQVTDVAPSQGNTDVPIDNAVRVAFNRPVVPLTGLAQRSQLTNPLEIDPPIQGSGEWINTSLFSFTPAELWQPGTRYTVTIRANLRDTTGGILSEDYVWSFTTQLPAVIRVLPENVPDMADPGPKGSVFTPPTTTVQIIFNQAMDQQESEARFTLTAMDQTTAIQGKFTWTSNTLVFTPDKPLTKGALYQVQLRAGAPALNGGAAILQDFQSQFWVAPIPAVVSYQPGKGETGVKPGTNIQVTFSSPISASLVTKGLEMTKGIEIWPKTEYYTYWSYDYTTAYIAASLLPSTRYTVTLTKQLIGAYGDPLAQEVSFSFTTGPSEPDAHLVVPNNVALYSVYNQPAVAIQYVNVSRLDMTLYRLAPETFVSLNSEGSKGSGKEPQEYQLAENDLVRRWSIPVEAALNESTRLTVDLIDADGKPLAPGLYFMQLSGAESTTIQRQLIIIGDTNLMLKTTSDRALVWATDLQSGLPIAGVALQFYSSSGQLVAESVTDQDGLATAALPAQEPWMRLIVVAKRDNGTSAVLSDWSDGIGLWDYGYYGAPASPTYFGYLYTDRQIYRPGQQVYFKGILRLDNDAQYALPAPGVQVHVAVLDSQGRQVMEQTLLPNDLGTFDGSFALADGATTGAYQIVATAGKDSFSTVLQVAEYRKPEFVVSVSSAKPEYTQGDQIQAAGEALYYTGNPLMQASVSWRVLRQPYYFDRWPGQEPYSFGDYDSAELDLAPDNSSGFVAEGVTATDGAGRFSFQLTADLSQQRQSQIYDLEALVTDVSNQEVSERTSTIVHKGAFYIGVLPASYVAAVGEPQGISLITVDTQGMTRTNQALLVTVFQRVWYSAQEQAADGTTSWVNKVQDTPVSSYTVRSDARGYAVVGFTPTESGLFKILVTGVDEKGNQVYSSAFIWVSGQGYVNWGQQNNNRIVLVADKKSYQVGDIARILIPSPFLGKVKALLTIERGQIIEKRLIDLEGTSQVLEIPILADYAPNVYISVFIVQGTDKDNPQPGFRLGYVMLPVATAHKELQITLTPQSSGPFKPRDVVTYDIAVLSDQGQGVQAELSLDLVDEAIWALTGGDSRDIVNTFYQQRSLGVQTSASLSVLPSRQNEVAPSNAKGGSGGIPDAGIVRGAFKDTALWLPTVRTDATGHATISVELPDNLTSWRMTAQAITADSAVGKAHNSIISRLDLMVRPIIPRFLVIGDEPMLSCSIQNSTDQLLDLTVSLTTEGVSVDNAQQKVSVEAHSQAVVSWAARVNEGSSQAKVQFQAAGGDYQDSVELTLPVYHPTSPEVVGTAGEVQQTTVELIRLPEGIDPSLGNLTIEIDPSLAAGMSTSLDYLKMYPYDSIEQTISRFLPNLATYLAQQQLGLAQGTIAAQLPQEITIALQRIYAQQNADGGWGWWLGENSDPLLTAYALQGLTLIRQAGFTVDTGVWQRCSDYLKQWLSVTQPDTHELHNQQASILYALAEAGQGDLGRTVLLYEDRGDMALYAQAYLALALQRLNPAEQTRPMALIDNLISKAVLTAGGATWQEERLDAWGLNSDTRSTAIILRALVRLQPGNALLPNVVRWLMSARVDGHWKTTQETAWTILALTDYMVASGDLKPEYDYRLSLGQDVLTQANVTSASITESFSTTVPIAALHATETPLVIERSSGPGNLYYSAYLRYYLPAARLQPLNRGLIVQRQYTVADNPDTIATEGKINELITVKLTLIVPHDVYYLTLEDFIPAGCEVVDTSLQTTRQLQPEQKGFRQDQMPFNTGDDGRDRWLWGWPWATHTEIRDNEVVLFANALTSGTYEYTYQVRCTTPGLFQVMPAIAYEMYQPDRFGRSEGLTFRIAP